MYKHISFALVFIIGALYIHATPAFAASSYTDADCAPPNGTGKHLDKIVFAGSGKVSNVGSELWVKNCSLNNKHTVSATIYKMICPDQNGKSCDTPVTTRKTTVITLRPGGTYKFSAPSFAISCGSAQTDIHVNEISETAGTYYQSPKGPCKKPATAKTTAILGRIIQGTTYWQNSENKCGTTYPSAKNLKVGIYKVNGCNPHPFYQSGDIKPGFKSLAISGLPRGYTCRWDHEVINSITKKAEKIASGNNCYMSGRFDALNSDYENAHFVTYYITKK